MRKIGIFGGTFDPVHKGHLGIASQVLALGIVDKIFLVPALHPPHKNGAWAPYNDRVAMLRAALKGQDNLAVSLVEQDMHGPCYTLHTLEAVRNLYPDDRLYFVMGADSLLDFPHWYRFDEIAGQHDLIVLARPGIADDFCRSAISGLPGNYTLVFQEHGLRVYENRMGRSVFWLVPEQGWPVSSTEIRAQLAQGQTPHGLARPVLEYIRAHQLYSNHQCHAAEQQERSKAGNDAQDIRHH